MNNIILPLNSEFEKAAEFIKSVKRKDCTFFVGITSEGKGKIKPSKYVKVFVYKSGSAKEEIINALSSEIGEGRIIILRKLVTPKELDGFISSETDITVCATKKRNKFSNFFYKLWKKIVHAMFDFTFFDGDVSVVAISERLAPVAKNLKNLSYASRINRWKGITESQVEVSTPPAKKEYKKVRVNFGLVGWSALFLAMIASTVVYFLFRPATFLSCFLWACGIFLSLVSLVLSIVIYILNVRTGKRIFKEAEREE